MEITIDHHSSSLKLHWQFDDIITNISLQRTKIDNASP